MSRKVSATGVDLKAKAAMAVAFALSLLPVPAPAQDAAARAAQAEFERFRVARLPWSNAPGSGPCDEIVGRFCYWHDDPDDRRPLPLEPADVAAARDSLLARLDAAAARVPGDGWVLGQRVRYRIEAGRPGEAAVVAATCGTGVTWWCAALEGAARHAARDYPAAERAFERALATMPPSARERWEDLDPILDAEARRIWRGLGPGGRAAFARRVWWAADPLWSVPGNDRRTEHLARQVWDRLQEGAASAYDVAWGSDLRELLVRYGWPVAWERSRRDRGRLGAAGRPGVVAHDPPGARRFVPTLAAIADPAAADTGEWPLDDAEPRATYAPGYARRFLSLEPQVAAFRRGEESIVVAGWSLEDDSVTSAAAVEAALVVAAGPDLSVREARAAATATGGTLQVRVPWSRAVVGVEVLAEGVAARSRSGRGLPEDGAGPPGLSDLLLLAPGARLPSSLAEATPLARRSTTVATGESLPVFWEIYPDPGRRVGPVSIDLTLEPADPGFGARLARALRLAREPGGAGLRWSESLPSAPVVARSVALRLPELPAGRYVLRLRIVWPGEDARVARRAITVLPR